MPVAMYDLTGYAFLACLAAFCLAAFSYWVGYADGRRRPGKKEEE